MPKSAHRDGGTVPKSTVSKSTPPLVTVIMSMRNSSATVGAAIKSVQLQTLQDWEFIIIDDGSTDSSATIVSTIEDARIFLFKEAECKGLATRLNQAVALARGDFIARMDADDICFPERLALQVAKLREDPTIDVLSCAAVVFSDSLRLIGNLPIELAHRDIVGQPFSGFPFPHPTWCGRAKWFRENPYDPHLMRAQDQDLLLRTFAFSHFSAIAEVLIGYRQDVIDLNKRLQGRHATILSLWNYARSHNYPLPALSGIGLQVFKSVMEIVTIAFGLNRQVQRRRLKPVSAIVTKRWMALQKELDAFSSERPL